MEKEDYTYDLEINDSLYEDQLKNSTFLIDSFNTFRKVNLYITLIFMLIGIIGHILTIFVFSQKRFRKNSSNVYFLCLAINDALFLITHFFEDSIRTFIDLYFKENMDELINAFNITDRFILACYMINYLRYVFRFVSAYIIVAFTVQRLYLVCSPFSRKFKSTTSAWKTISILVFIALTINLWVPFIFEKSDGHAQSVCVVKKELNDEYYIFTLVYICLIMLVPIVIIIISNSIIITCLLSSNHRKIVGLRRNKQQSVKVCDDSSFVSDNSLTIKSKKVSCIRCVLKSKYKDSFKSNNSNLKPYYLSVSQIIGRVAHRASSPIKITRMLVIISFSYAFLNLPYLIAWLIYNYNIKFISFISDDKDLSDRTHWFSIIKITEIFNLLNYSISFYVYCASGSVFRNQLRYSSKIEFIFKQKLFLILIFYF